MLSIWSLRRVLLAGQPACMLHCMQAQLHALGARVQLACDPFTGESLFCTLHEGRFSCVIVPDLLRLCAGGADAHHTALDMLLGEAREAGVPLVMLLCPSPAAHGEEAASLLSHARGWACGAFGDPVSVQCICHSNSNAPQTVQEALLLGARFFAGETGCTGVFSAGK